MQNVAIQRQFVDLPDGSRLFHGDAIDMLESLEPCSVDMIATDPPYSSGGTTSATRSQDPSQKYQSGDAKTRHRSFDGDMRDQRSFVFWSTIWMRKAYAAVKVGGVAAVFTDWRQLPATTDAFQAAGFVWRGTAVWQKVGPRPQKGKFANACEYVVWGSKGAMDSSTKATYPGAWTMPSPRTRFHIAQKPIELMEGLLQIAPRGGIVVDPFMGSGTTGIAAVRQGLRFIGSESDEEFFAKATERIALELEGRP